MRRHAVRLRPRRAVATLLVLVVAAGPAGLQAAEPPDEGLAAGPWWAAGSARGTATASEGGLELVWRGRIPAQFQFDVKSDGSASGSWDHQGESVMTFHGSALPGEARGDLAYEGSGSVSGTNRRLVLNGSSRTTGAVTITAQGQTQRFPVDNVSKIPTLYLNVRATICDEAYGDWAYTVREAFEDEGFSATITGWWVGVRESDQVRLHAEELALLAAETGAAAPGIDSESPLLELAANVIRSYNELADGLTEATLGQVFKVLSDAEVVLNTLRNLSECDEQLFGEENVDKYINLMTLVIQGLITGGQDLDPESDGWQLMVQIAARTGAIGAGATDPAAAAQTEEALIAEGSEILEEHYDPATDSVAQNEDTIRVMATGAAMNWTYEVGGEPFPARPSYEKNFGTAPTEP